MNARNKIYVGNLPFGLSEDEFKEKFSEFGAIDDAVLIMDRNTGRPKGFGFVTYTTPEAADKAIQAMNNQELGGRSLRVNLAQPKDSSDGDRRRGSGNPHRFSDSDIEG